MIINFDKIEAVKNENFKGGEKCFFIQIFADEKNKIIKGRLEPGGSIGMHRHEGNSETIIIQEGNGKVVYEGEEIKLKAGDVHYCAEGCEHSLINDSDDDLHVLAIIPTYA